MQTISRLLTLLLLIPTVCLAASVTVYAADKPVIPATMPSNVTDILSKAKIDSMRFDEDLGLYEIISRGNVLYMSKDYKYVFVGNIINVQTMRNLTAEKVSALRKVSFSDLDTGLAIKLSNGPRSIAVFTDPECPYCEKLHKELAKLHGVAVYTFLMPIKEIHPTSQIMANRIWCSQDKVKALNDHFAGQSLGASQLSCEAPTDKIMAYAQKHNIEATPTIVYDDGRVISGYVDAKTIEDNLSSGAGK